MKPPFKIEHGSTAGKECETTVRPDTASHLSTSQKLNPRGKAVTDTHGVAAQ